LEIKNMSIQKITNWGEWWIGLRQNIIKCIGTTGTAWLGTNAASAAGVPVAGINWEQALAMFGVHIAFEVFSYLKENQPKVIEQEVNTTFTAMRADGTTVQQSSKTVTTTPVPEEPKQ